MAELKPVDRLEITILVDNSIDVFLPSTDEIRRAQIPSELPWGERKALLSEHGYSALVSVHTGDRSASLLFDAVSVPMRSSTTWMCSKYARKSYIASF